MNNLFGEKLFEKGIGYLDFKIVKNSEKPAVVLVDEYNEQIETLSPYQIFDLEKANKIGVTAVYFRYFENRPPQAQIYIIDKTDGSFSDINYAHTHRNIWSSCDVPISIILTNSEIRIYDCRKPVTVSGNTISIQPEYKLPLKNLAAYNDVIEKYNALKFDNGSFWESEEASNKYLYNRSAYNLLTAKLKSVRHQYKSKSKLNEDLSDRLLITCILIKYLEENGISEDKKNLAALFFEEKTGFSSLQEIIKGKKLVLLLSELSEHFNGGIFEFTSKEKSDISKSDFTLLIDFLTETVDSNNQLFLWKQYSFKYIPVELISNFYEEFLPKEAVQKQGAVYTPSFMVELLVDQCLPLSRSLPDLNEDIKLIDVSCGSGIFLVTTYKRLVSRYLLKQRLNGTSKDITARTLIRILKNVHGVDENQKAVNLTLFSLSLAVCSFLTPRKIWTELKFEDLVATHNIEEQDFFSWIDKTNINKFDLVIGNPPFKELKEERFSEITKDLLKKGIKVNAANPSKQIALLFLEVAMKLLKPEKLLCLIIPSGPLLYFDNSLLFRKDFFSLYNVPQVFDFTYLRRILFQATVSVAAVFVENRPPLEDDISHVIFKRTQSVSERQYFEIDHYDTFFIPKQLNLNNQYLWKYNLIGGGVVKNTVERLILSYQNSTIKEFLERKKKEANWNYGLARGQKFQTSNFLLFAKRITHGNFPILIGKDQINWETYYISAPAHDKLEFDKFRASLVQNGGLYSFLMAATSARQGLRGPYTIYPSDFFRLPYDPQLIPLSKTEKIVIEDVINYKISEFGEGEDSEINKNIYLNGKRNNDSNVFESFGETFSEVLNFFYKKNNYKYGLTDIYEGKSYFACEFNFTTKNSSPKIHASDDDIKDILENRFGRNLFINRNLRLYNDAQIILVKPKQLRYWLPSIALRDADETLSDILIKLEA